MLLALDEPPAFQVERVAGASPFLLTCDHAGARIPWCLGSLGLSSDDVQRHIGWDIGAAAVTRRLAEALDATAILQTYSRLVIDCNRPLESVESIATLSEDTVIPGNAALSPEDITSRIEAVFKPYHEAIRQTLADRRDRGQPTVLIAMHSFTPVYRGDKRPWHIGVLSHRDRRLADALLQALRSEPDLVVGDNQPYSVGDDTDYAIPVYGERGGLLHVEVEIRQDLITDPAGQQAWAGRLARLLPPLSSMLT